MSHLITDRQRVLLGFVARFTKQNGYPPSVRDIAIAMEDISTNAVHNHINACIKKGYLSKAPRIARSLQVTLAAQAEIRNDV